MPIPKNPMIRKARIHEIKPYHRNPRENNEAIEKVRESISKFGYRQLICVDANNVIIAGHSRYKALLDLGYEEIDVIDGSDLTEQEAKAYRIIDNKTSEYATWTDDLTLELRELSSMEGMQLFFEDKIDLDLSFGKESKPIDFGKEQEKMDKQYADLGRKAMLETQEVTCPQCGNDFNVSLNKMVGGS